MRIPQQTSRTARRRCLDVHGVLRLAQDKHRVTLRTHAAQRVVVITALAEIFPFAIIVACVVLTVNWAVTNHRQHERERMVRFFSMPLSNTGIVLPDKLGTGTKTVVTDTKLSSMWGTVLFCAGNNDRLGSRSGLLRAPHALTSCRVRLVVVLLSTGTACESEVFSTRQLCC